MDFVSVFQTLGQFFGDCTIVDKAILASPFAVVGYELTKSLKAKAAAKRPQNSSGVEPSEPWPR